MAQTPLLFHALSRSTCKIRTSPAIPRRIGSSQIGLLLLWVLAIMVTSSVCFGEEKPILLQYRLAPGQQLTMRVEHFAETYTIMAERHERGFSRTVTQKTWDVQEVTPDGEATIVYRIDWVNLAQSIDDGEETAFDSRQDAEPPEQFKPVAETIGIPLATVTIDRQGNILSRDQEEDAPNLGMGDLAVPLPNHPVAVGDSWDVPRTARARLDDGAYKAIKIREHYTLEKVAGGVATIRIDAQPLTPIRSSSVESQLLQQLSHGTIQFDIQRGVVLNRRLDWDKEVVGFRGPNTSLRYRAKFEEKLLPATRSAANQPTGKNK